MTCGPCAYGRSAERVEQVARTSTKGGVLRGKRFAFMACDCVAAVDYSFRNLRAVRPVRLFGQIPPISAFASFQDAITCSS
jgi:hypothetical protein